MSQCTNLHATTSVSLLLRNEARRIDKKEKMSGKLIARQEYAKGFLLSNWRFTNRRRFLFVFQLAMAYSQHFWWVVVLFRARLGGCVCMCFNLPCKIFPALDPLRDCEWLRLASLFPCNIFYTSLTLLNMSEFQWERRNLDGLFLRCNTTKFVLPNQVLEQEPTICLAHPKINENDIRCHNGNRVDKRRPNHHDPCECQWGKVVGKYF